MSIKVKLIVAVIILVTYSAVTKVFDLFYPVVTNQVAMTQMKDSAQSYTDWSTYKLAWQIWWSGWVVVALILVLMFWNEISRGINSLKEG